MKEPKCIRCLVMYNDELTGDNVGTSEGVLAKFA
jgi:hypothetical protein